MYVAENSSGTPYAVCVVGYTKRCVLAEDVPMLCEDTGGFRVMQQGTHRINADAAQERAAAAIAAPLTRRTSSRHKLMRVHTYMERGNEMVLRHGPQKHYLPCEFHRVDNVRAYVQHSWGHD